MKQFVRNKILVLLLVTVPSLGAMAASDVEDSAVETKKEKSKKDLGVQCKRVKKIGSNRIQRVCTTAAQRKKQDASNKESQEWLEEQQRSQELYETETIQNQGSSPN